jgi:excisionase family DNA binding protein
MSVPEAARHIGMSPNRFRQLILRGKLPPGIAYRPAGLRFWKIDLAALDEWVRNGCFTVTPDDDGEAVS